MNLTQELAPQLPYLRRYARAITGSQALGDSAVRTTLQTLLDNVDNFDTALSPRVSLYRFFHQVHPNDDSPPVSVLGGIGQLTSRMRQLLLLTSVEGFAPSEAATICGIDAEIVDRDLDHARSIVTDHLASDVLVIEDEAIIALHIKSIVKSLGHQVVGVARTSREAIELARTTSPELVLADISLADGSSGIDAVNEILAEMDVPVIFVTAFPERLLTGERPEPTYLITKPFEPITLTATIAQALLLHRENTPAESEPA
jgi:CheY-like chemotaxis protein